MFYTGKKTTHTFGWKQKLKDDSLVTTNITIKQFDLKHVMQTIIHKIVKIHGLLAFQFKIGMLKKKIET